MAEAVGIAAGVGGILKALVSTGVYLNGTASASSEAQAITDQVQATEAILKALEASLRTIQRPDKFYRIWAEPTKLVLGNIKTTVEDLNKTLGAQKGKARLSFWGKAKWPFTREDSILVQQHLQAYM
jgi:hypothetical protein